MAEAKFELSKEKNVVMHLVKRPVGNPKADDFAFVQTELRELADGEVLIKNEYLSIDPTHRIWMNDEEGYMPQIKLNEPFRSLSSGTVVLSKHKDFKAGDAVSCLGGIQNYVIGKPEHMMVNKLPPFASLTTALDFYGINGLTAYLGLLNIGHPQQGETVLVSGAAGAVGCVVGQIAKLKGCRVVGIAGSDDKCSWLTNDLGFDAAVNYKRHNSAEALKAALQQACPQGVDVFFDNVGGQILDVALELINLRARIVICGAISQYNNDKHEGISNMRYVLFKRAKIEGFVFTDFVAQIPQALTDLYTWEQQNKIKVKPPHIEQGLTNYPKVVLRLFDGSNTGKLMIKI